MRLRLSARSRLTILYTLLVLAAGIALTVLTYVLMLRSQGPHAVRIDLTPGGPPAGNLPDPPDIDQLVARIRAATVAEFLGRAAIALTLVTLLAAGLGWVVAGRVLRPIRAISATAQRLSAENLDERVPVTTPPDELAALADTVNRMLDRIQNGLAERERILASQRMFTANAAHELRTPLTTMRTAIDVTLDGEPDTGELLDMATDVRTAIERTQRMLDGLLVLARSQAGPGEQQAIDLADVAARALDGATDRAEDGGIVVRSELDPATIHGEPVLIERLLGNLVDNALRYNVAGGHVDLTTGNAADQAYLRIVNSGRRIASGRADRLLEPFVHGDSDRTGADGGIGLGLSIVRAIATAHRGEVCLVARASGGLDITVHLPAIRPAAQPFGPRPIGPLSADGAR